MLYIQKLNTTPAKKIRGEQCPRSVAVAGMVRRRKRQGTIQIARDYSIICGPWFHVCSWFHVSPSETGTRINIKSCKEQPVVGQQIQIRVTAKKDLKLSYEMYLYQQDSQYTAICYEVNFSSIPVSVQWLKSPHIRWLGCCKFCFVKPELINAGTS